MAARPGGADSCGRKGSPSAAGRKAAAAAAARMLRAVVVALMAGALLHGGGGRCGGVMGLESGDDAGTEGARRLYRHWESAYGLDSASLLPPPAVRLPPGVPPAPHLELCAQRAAWRERMEARGRDGEAPAWTRPAACGGVPQPPWVRGPDAANLARTREAQRDLWEQQFPASCAGRRLVLIPWLNMASFGVGAQLHVVSAVLAAAVLHNRTLVMLPGSMGHADHAHCDALGARGSLSCYFFPMASADCEARAMAAHHSGAMVPCNLSSVASDATVVFGCSPKLGKDAAVAMRWGSAFKDQPVLHEVEGAMYPRTDDKIRKKHWWRAQSIRFMLRWPSRYLCHITNRERHTAYGMHVAAQLATTASHEAALLSTLLSLTPLTPSPPPANSTAPAPAAPPSEQQGGGLATHAWPLMGYHGCDDASAATAAHAAMLSPHPTPAASAPSEAPTASTAAASAAAASVAAPSAAAPGAAAAGSDIPPLPLEEWSAAEATVLVGPPVYMPRPIASMHVRQGDKAKEMRLFSFYSYMHLANRLRRHEPNLKAVWLSTEMQSVVDQTSHFPDWTFYYSHLPRQGAQEAMANYSTATGLDTVVGVSFANLLIAADCDYFVGTLGSNWNRLINELKSTSGRLFAGYVSLNFGEW